MEARAKQESPSVSLSSPSQRPCNHRGAKRPTRTCGCVSDCDMTQEKFIPVMAFIVVLWRLVKQHKAEMPTSCIHGKGEGTTVLKRILLKTVRVGFSQKTSTPYPTERFLPQFKPLLCPRLDVLLPSPPRVSGLSLNQRSKTTARSPKPAARLRGRLLSDHSPRRAGWRHPPGKRAPW